MKLSIWCRMWHWRLTPFKETTSMYTQQCCNALDNIGLETSWFTCIKLLNVKKIKKSLPTYPPADSVGRQCQTNNFLRVAREKCDEKFSTWLSGVKMIQVFGKEEVAEWWIWKRITQYSWLISSLKPNFRNPGSVVPEKNVTKNIHETDELTDWRTDGLTDWRKDRQR